MRIDRLLCELNIGSRTEAKRLLKSGQILVDGVRITKPEERVDENTAVILFKGKEYRYRRFVYFMMNKPAGFISATRDDSCKTVLDLFAQQYALLYGNGLFGSPAGEIFPAGRLDKDSTGLLLLTNDGALAHALLSPKKHVPKTYYVETDLSLSGEKLLRLENGVDIGEERPTQKARIERITGQSCTITITEGKFHQVKRMFQAVDLKVTYLKRLSIGSLRLDPGLAEGGIRELTKEEVSQLCQKLY